MEHYIINKNAQSKGEHEIHLLYHYLGSFSSYSQAETKARMLGYTNIDACKHCLPRYHTKRNGRVK